MDPASALTLSMNFPIFHGFSTNAKIASAKLDLQKTVTCVKTFQIENEIETAKNNFQTAITTLDFQKQNRTWQKMFTIKPRRNMKREPGTRSRSLMQKRI